MEYGTSHERHDPNPEGVPGAVDRLPEQLGFVETDELRRLRELATESHTLVSKERLASLVLEYQLRGEELLNGMNGSERARGQVGLIVARATLSRDMGDVESFLYHIGDATEYARALQEEAIVAVLERAPSAEIVRALSPYKVFGFDQETLAEIADEPYEVAFEIAYGYLAQMGLDADEILASFLSE